MSDTTSLPPLYDHQGLHLYGIISPISIDLHRSSSRSHSILLLLQLSMYSLYFSSSLSDNRELHSLLLIAHLQLFALKSEKPILRLINSGGNRGLTLWNGRPQEVSCRNCWCCLVVPLTEPQRINIKLILLEYFCKKVANQEKD